MAADDPTWLYRLWDRNGNLLYVGISRYVTRRIDQHDGKYWAREISQVTGDKYPSRELARAAEVEAIRSELPKYNVQDTAIQEMAEMIRTHSGGI